MVLAAQLAAVRQRLVEAKQAKDVIATSVVQICTAYINKCIETVKVAFESANAINRKAKEAAAARTAVAAQRAGLAPTAAARAPASKKRPESAPATQDGGAADAEVCDFGAAGNAPGPSKQRHMSLLNRSHRF